MRTLSFTAASMSKLIPQGEHGSARVLHETPDAIDRLRGKLHGQPLEHDLYTRLVVNGRVCSADFETECETKRDIVGRMTGDVLIAGLGIGYVIPCLLERRDVISVIVIERNPDVIALVEPHLRGAKLQVLEADPHEWTPPTGAYDCCFLDIWTNIPDAADWKEIEFLKQKYGPCLRPGGWSAAWCEDLAKEDWRLSALENSDLFEESLEEQYVRYRFTEHGRGHQTSIDRG